MTLPENVDPIIMVFELTDLIIMVFELTIGRLVLDLPKEDLEKINEMLKKNFGDKKE